MESGESGVPQTKLRLDSLRLRSQKTILELIYWGTRYSSYQIQYGDIYITLIGNLVGQTLGFTDKEQLRSAKLIITHS